MTSAHEFTQLGLNMPAGLRKLMQIWAATDDDATSPRLSDEIAKVKKSRRSYERARSTSRVESRLG